MKAKPFAKITVSELKRFLYKDVLSISTKAIRESIRQLGIYVRDEFIDFLSDFYTEAFTGMILSMIQGLTSYNR